MKSVFVAVAMFGLAAGAASACPFSMDKTAEAPILKPAPATGS